MSTTTAVIIFGSLLGLGVLLGTIPKPSEATVELYPDCGDLS